MDVMDFTTRYGKLNAAQKQAVDTIDGPVMVIAGPGTGKTELLSMRAANILKKTDTLPENILCLTFTDSGADAMRRRLVEIIGPSAYKVAIHTFHSFGAEIINQNGTFFYHGANFRAADELGSYELLRKIFDELDYANPLAVKMNGEYTYLKDTLAVISELKKSGLTSDELLSILDTDDQVIDTAEPLLGAVFAGRINKTTGNQLEQLIEPIRKSAEQIALPGIVSLATVLSDNLETAISEAAETNSTKPLTSWRNAWMKKDETGDFVLKSRERIAKLRAASYVYYQYLARMQEAELYDFDDMILRVVHAMEVFPELRLNLQEKYQYVMVDEFQDTNLAQMRILHNLTSNEINNGRPNILVVGDDDQAIYSFQGADVSNIHNFRHLFNETALVVLTDNYRSTEAILSHARSVITLGGDRLENTIPELNKTLTPHRVNPLSSTELIELPSLADERAWLAETIAEKIEEGIKPSTIAILARRHHELIHLLPYLTKKGISVNYERRDNVLDLEIIRLIELIATILVMIFEQRHQDADSLMPELLAHPAFAMAPLDIWQLSMKAHQSHSSWMEIMRQTPQFQSLHEWLVSQAQALKTTPLEHMIDEITGHISDESRSSFTSPIFNYYFSTEQLEKTPEDYLVCLEALRTIRAKLRNYAPDEQPTVQSFLEFIRVHRQLGAPITSIRPRSQQSSSQAVTLMTAHKSKGLEYDHVYVMGAVDSSWGARVRSRSRLISYPENLPLTVSGDTADERMRLFFVAMTRARLNLTISYSTNDDNGKPTDRANFLLEEPWSAATPDMPSTPKEQIEHAETRWYEPIVHPIDQDMQQLLVPMLENYKLSATHLNNFLDISRGGPQKFLINNLLRFPQAMSPSASYGSAIHATLQRAHSHLAATGKPRPAEDILHDFEKSLETQHLPEADFHLYLQKGIDSLSTFLEAKYQDFKPTQRAELNFAGQAVFLGNARLTGSLDLVDIDKTEKVITVTDYKTGRPARDWSGKSDYEKVKLHKYRQQLMFYNLLIQHSRDFSSFRVEKGILQFVEATPKGEIVALEATFSHEDLERFTRLIQAVWEHILALDFPSTDDFEPSYKGMLAFEASLLGE
jgi:DNA helicase-2/ATP-dependent DNA helicase PcrA